MNMLIKPVKRTNGRRRRIAPSARGVARARAVSTSQPVQEPTQQRAMSVSNMATPFGTNFFSQCTDEIMSLHYGNELPFLDWIGWQVSDTLRRELEFIAYVRPAQSGGNSTPGHLSDPCTDPNGIEYGKAELNVEGFGRYGRKGPDRDVMRARRYCQTDPVRRLDGEIVANEAEWDLRFAVDQVIGDIRADVITGNSSVDGQFGGLEEWVSTSYTGQNASILHSNVINFNSNYMAGGAGMSWNGTSIQQKPGGGYYNLIDILLEAWRRTRTRISWTRQLRNQQLRVGDAVLMTTSQQARLVLDHFTCWSVCDGGQYSPVNLQQREARNFRNRLVAADNPANLYGHGYVILDNTIIPIMAYDEGITKSATVADMYLLVGNVGSIRVWEGEHLSAEQAVSAFALEGNYASVDGGRILTQTKVENLCRNLKAWMFPRIWCRAPWAQTRIMNVKGSSAAGILSVDPDSSFYPVTSFTPATMA